MPRCRRWPLRRVLPLRRRLRLRRKGTLKGKSISPIKVLFFRFIFDFTPAQSTPQWRKRFRINCSALFGPQFYCAWIISMARVMFNSHLIWARDEDEEDDGGGMGLVFFRLLFSFLSFSSSSCELNPPVRKGGFHTTSSPGRVPEEAEEDFLFTSG